MKMLNFYNHIYLRDVPRAFPLYMYIISNRTFIEFHDSIFLVVFYDYCCYHEATEIKIFCANITYDGKANEL